MTYSITRIIGTIALIAAGTNSALAQTPAPSARKLEVRVSDGAFLPTGSQRDVLKDARVTSAQLSWVIRPSLAITGTFAWARSRDIAAIVAPKLDVFTSDIGIEARSAEWCAECRVSFSGFAGLGAGARSYNYRSQDVDATHNLAGYASAGGEIGLGRVGLRLEVRDYASGFKPLTGRGESATTNDVVILAAVRFNVHQ